MEVKEFHRGIMKKVTAQNVAEEIEVIKETYPPEGLLQSLGPLFDCLKWLEIRFDLLGVPWEEQELLVFNLAFLFIP